MEAICSSETSVDFQRPESRYIPEDRRLRYRRKVEIKRHSENSFKAGDKPLEGGASGGGAF
jgi:hypothetical protein